MTRYWESTLPGSARRPPRADALSDAASLSLNGTWRFRLAPTAEGTGEGFLEAEFDDSDWDAMPVPSHWVLQQFTPLAGGPARSMIGTAEGPLYTNTAYPIPLDPPRVPTANPTGDYRLRFQVPAGFGAAVLRFRGVDSCARVWLNGTELGWSMGSRLPFEFDAPVGEGSNLLCVRVHRWSAGTYLEDQDMWWLPGIFRDVELISRPDAAIDDHFVHADYDAATGLGTLRVEAPVSAVVEIPELGLHLPAGETAVLPVDPWSAESPRLYRGTLCTSGETISLAVGFRRVEITDGVLIVNGHPLKFRGVNRHEHHPDTGRTLDRETMVRDIVMMKQANIDSVRTSHYPPHPEFLRLCDEYGLWVIVECDLETHGFIYAGWQGNPPAEPAWRDALLDRLRRTVEPNKNRPSVVIWSLANESWTGETFDAMEQWVRERDPSRPVLYERDPSYRNSDFYSTMYPALELLEQVGLGAEPTPEAITPAEDERRRKLPYLLIEYAHAMGNGPGSLLDYRRIIEAHERLCGGFVWEWIDHGFNAERQDGTSFILHGEDVAYQPSGGRFNLDGLLFSDRTATPGLVELAKSYAPLEILVDTEITVVNKRHGATTADLDFSWTLESDGMAVAGGRLQVAPIAVGGRAVLPLPIDVPPAAVLTVEAILGQDQPWATAGHVVAWGQLLPASDALEPLRPPYGGRAATHRISLGPAEFDATNGRLVRLGDLELDGPWLDLHRAPTENDHGQGGLNDLASVWAATGLNRMLHRTDEVEEGSGWLRVAGRTAPAGHPHGVAWSMLWRASGTGLELEVTADFVGPWHDTPYLHRDILVPRLGLLFLLPGEFEQASWFGRGPGETYVDSWEGSRIGWFDSPIDALQVPYAVPQENGNHVQTRSLEMRATSLPALRFDGHPEFAFTARRWTSLDLERATKPDQLQDTGQVWLNIDHAQQGIGSASVGPALPERYRVPRKRTTWRVGLSTVSRPRSGMTPTRTSSEL